MNGSNITKCVMDRHKCLGNDDCCYECNYRGWCDSRCQLADCRHERIYERVYGSKGMEVRANDVRH